MYKQRKNRLSVRLKLVVLVCLIAALSVATKHFNIQGILHNSLIWVKSLGPLQAIAFIAIYNLATVLFIPGSLLTLGGGVLFGVFWGSIYVFIAATLGATLAFLIGRYLSRGWVSRLIEGHANFKAIDEAVAREGFKIVLLTRLSPIFPFNLLNYAFGVTQVSVRNYVLGSIGMVPGIVIYVYIGSLAGDLAMIGMSNQSISPKTQIVQWVARIVGLIATMAVTVYITRIAKKALDQTVTSEKITQLTTKNG